ncbi:hypothetical protein, partial [Thorsellia anophelis]
PQVPPVDEVNPEVPDNCKPIELNYSNPQSSARSYTYPTITDFYVTGKVAEREILTVHYTFIPADTNDPYGLANGTLYEFGPAGTTRQTINFSSPRAGYPLVAGKNSFNLAPLTKELLKTDLEVSLWALNEYYEGTQILTYSFSTLQAPCK